ncbi:MAG: phage major capsid protein, partial [Alphaproteobacteria bacterium]
ATGIQAKWRAEASQMTATKLVTEPRQVRLHELYAFATATDSLIEDAPRLQDRLMRKAPQAIRYKIDEAIINGTGVGQPQGYFNSAALISVAKEGSQAADTIVTNNIAKMYSRLLSSGLSRAFWLVNSDVLPQLMTLVIGNQPIWTPPNAGLRDAPGGFLLGRPVVFSEHAKTLGDKGDIQLLDLMGYYAANKRSGIKFDSSMHLFFDYGMQAFRWTFRFGGQPYLSAPVAPANGANTKSHFVTLDERA